MSWSDETLTPNCDTKSTCTQSLAPSVTSNDSRRILLLIYIHGFLGDDNSFQNFPAHIHNLLKVRVADTHIVRTKIYPRYKSRRAIDYARDEFSKWLKPQENAHTDIVLLGHSMGGLLAAEVVLQPAGTVFEHSFRHRILGTLNFDTPFLGMHLGMIRSGIASFFRPAPEPQSFQNHPASEQLIYNTSGVLSSSTPSLLSHETPKRVSTPGVSTSSISPSVHSLPISDPDYNPPFQNDIRRPVRTGFDRFIYFSNKHSGALRSATKEYFISHLEFGGCLGDFRGLKRQYARIRGLEDVATAFKTADPRLRFLNIYTASTGRIKRKKHSRSSDTSTQTLPSQAAIPTYLQQPSTPTNHNPKPIRDKIFCIQPSTVDGKPDPCWPRIFMEGVDEIDAHCGLFFPGKHYEGLLELVVGRLESWVVQNSVGGEGA